jgi:hypothetical protein
MIDSIKAQLQDWKYGRDILKSFILELEDKDLDKLFPRRNLNSIRKQCEELLQVQGCYLDALHNKVISFNYSPLHDISKIGLVKRMEELDDKMEKVLESCNGDETINWFGEIWLINRHLSAMIGHEQMHIGQIIGFCYSINIEIPRYIKRTMALTD